MRGVLYDRQLLLTGVKRNEILDLWEVQRYGSDSYGDADHVCIYGMRPADWYSKGIRLLGRTAVNARETASEARSARTSPQRRRPDLLIR